MAGGRGYLRTWGVAHRRTPTVQRSRAGCTESGSDRDGASVGLPTGAPPSSGSALEPREASRGHEHQDEHQDEPPAAPRSPAAPRGAHDGAAEAPGQALAAFSEAERSAAARACFVEPRSLDALRGKPVLLEILDGLPETDPARAGLKCSLFREAEDGEPALLPFVWTSRLPTQEAVLRLVMAGAVDGGRFVVKMRMDFACAPDVRFTVEAPRGAGRGPGGAEASAIDGAVKLLRVMRDERAGAPDGPSDDRLGLVLEELRALRERVDALDESIGEAEGKEASEGIGSTLVREGIKVFSKVVRGGGRDEDGGGGDDDEPASDPEPKSPAQGRRLVS